MARFVYLVKWNGRQSNPDFHQFRKNVTELGAIGTNNYPEITNPCLIGHHRNIEMIFTLCTSGIEQEDKVYIEEITTETIKDDNTLHSMYMDKITNYFFKKNKKDYVKLQFDEDEL